MSITKKLADKSYDVYHAKLARDQEGKTLEEQLDAEPTYTSLLYGMVWVVLDSIHEFFARLGRLGTIIHKKWREI